MRSRSRTIALVAGAALLLMVPTTVQATGTKDAKGPACSDILDNPNFGFDSTRQKVILEVLLSAPRCDGVLYQAAIFSPTFGAIAPSRSSWTTESSVVFEWDFNADYWTERLCAEASTTVGGGGHIADYSPDRLESGEPRTDETGQCIDQFNPNSPRTTYG